MPKKHAKLPGKLRTFLIFTIIALLAVLAVAALQRMTAPQPPGPSAQDLGGFCGTSSLGSCSSDADCVAGGCSNQVCYGKNEPPSATTCEWTECYDAQKYNVSCGCVAQKCAWRK